MKTGIVLLGHGSRIAEGNQNLHQAAELLSRQGSWQAVEPAFLQLAEPTLAQSIARLVAEGVEKIVVVSFFLCDGAHVRVDIPQAVADEAAKYQGVQIITTPPIGDDPRLLEIVKDRIESVSP